MKTSLGSLLKRKGEKSVSILKSPRRKATSPSTLAVKDEGRKRSKSLQEKSNKKCYACDSAKGKSVRALPYAVYLGRSPARRQFV